MRRQGGSDSEEEERKDFGRYGTIFTFAAKMGHSKPQLNGSTFSKAFVQYMTDFLKQSNGSLSLVESLLKIPPSVAETEINGITKEIKIFGRILNT